MYSAVRGSGGRCLRGLGRGILTRVRPCGHRTRTRPTPAEDTGGRDRSVEVRSSGAPSGDAGGRNCSLSLPRCSSPATSGGFAALRVAAPPCGGGPLPYTSGAFGAPGAFGRPSGLRHIARQAQRHRPTAARAQPRPGRVVALRPDSDSGPGCLSFSPHVGGSRAYLCPSPFLCRRSTRGSCHAAPCHLPGHAPFHD